MLNRIDGIVFDLDGTLVKSHLTIYKAVNKALHLLGYNYTFDEEKFYSLIGKHFNEIFGGLNIKIKNMDEFISLYKSFYFEFIDYSELYPDAVEVLQYLQNIKLKIGMLTTKGQDQAEMIASHFNLTSYFNIIVGRRNGLAHKPSADPLLLIADEFQLKPSNILMVGDSEADVRCGKNAGAKTCAVSFGYRTKEQLENEMPDILIGKLSELKILSKE